MNVVAHEVQRCLIAAALLTLGALSAQSATVAPTVIGTRALSPQDIKAYGLTGKQGASGLSTVGVGQPVYLEVMIPKAINATNLLSVTWSLNSKPIGSAVELTESPLGANVPVGQPSDSVTYYAGGRRVLKPDLEGIYTVKAVVTYANGVSNLTQKITASRYLGWSQGCIACHSGGILAPDMSSFTNTPHATALARKLDDSTGHFGANCVSCHSVGYDTNPDAVNGGFDDVAKEVGWTVPTVPTNGNWAAMPPKLQNVGNVQCENCHGPGSQHVMSEGIVGNPGAISVSFNSGSCAQCHDSPTHHIKTPEWNASRHAVATRTPSGAGRENCIRCHTSRGFAAQMEGKSTTDTTYSPIGCAACHDPHVGENPHQLRTGETVLMADGFTVVTNAGAGTICMNCHRSRNGSVTNSIFSYPLGLQTWAGGSAFGVHDNPASDMLEGVNGWTYGKNIPSSAHRFAVEDTCAGCHMQPVSSTDPAFLKAGGHSMNMTYQAVVNGATQTVDKVDVCTECHGTIGSFNMVKMDYNGDGVIEGVQTEVQNLLNKLSTMLPSSTYVPSGNYVADGKVKTSISAKTNWPSYFLKAGYNWQFVNNDLSKGVHNAAYAVGLLKASIADLTGDANDDGLPDEWQINYFGSANAANAAPDATPAGDGVPNWLKYSLGLDPMVSGIVVPGGVVWANAGTTGGSTNSIQIYTAAEIVFNTEAGKSYQLQSISSVNGTWSDIGEKIQGTGQQMSFVTPTRKSPTQFFRVNVQ